MLPSCPRSQSTKAWRRVRPASSSVDPLSPQPIPLAVIIQNLNCSRYIVAASNASSTLLTSVPLPMAIGAFPPALPPTTLETAADQSDDDAPALDAVYEGEELANYFMCKIAAN